MQMQPAVIAERLRLADPYPLFYGPGIDGAAISGALSEVLQAAGPAVLSEGARLRVLAEAGRRLLGEPQHLREALHVSTVAAPELADMAALTHIRLIALGHLGERAEMLKCANKFIQHGNINDDPHGVTWKILRRFDLDGVVTPNMSWHDIAWGPWAGDIYTQLKNIPDEGVASKKVDLAAKEIFANIGKPLTEYHDFRSRFIFGLKSYNYVRFVHLAFQQLARRRNEKLPEMEYDNTIVKLFDEINNSVQGIEIEQIREDIRRGRNIVIAGSHAGVQILIIDRKLRSFGLPLSIVSHFPAIISDIGDFHVGTKEDNSNLQFTKLCKKLKKEQRLVNIYPDGAAGEISRVSVLGRSMHIGRGAASLAYLGKAATYFLRSEWTGRGWRLVLDHGPRWNGESAAAFEQKFNSFYAKCLENILTGPPEDIGMLGDRFFNSAPVSR